MTDIRRIDPERLAALIDGRLDAAEAAVVRQQLASADPDTLAAFADAVSIANLPRVVSPSTAAAQLPRRPRMGAERWIASGLAVAAVLVAVLVWRPRPAADAYVPAEVVGAMSPVAPAVDGPVWSTIRGTADELSARGRATRIGALLTDLELDAARGESMRDHAYEIAALLEGAVGGTLVSSEFRALADSGARAPRSRLREIGRRAMRVVDARFAAAGAYLEAVRVAAAAGDSAFFARARPGGIGSVERDSTLSAADRASFAALDSLQRAQSRDLAAIQSAATALLRSLAK